MVTDAKTERRLGYLSAAPRVSTRPEAELGGPRSHVLGVIDAFEKLNWQVGRFIVGDRVPLNWVAKGSEQTLRRNRLRTLAADAMRVLMGFVNAQRARRELGTNVDWVYERFAAFQSLGWIFKKHHIPWILETNAPLFIESKKDRQTIMLTRVAEYLEKQAYQHCDVLVCISETLKEIIVKELEIPSSKVVVMPNGVDVTFFNPVIYQPLRLHSGFTIGFVGSLIDWQGLDLLLNVVSELNKDGYPIHLTFVGDGPAKSALEAQTKRLGLSEVVTFTGYVEREKVPAYIAGFDIGYSGQVKLKVGTMYLSPLKLYEYMAMAKPVLASNFEDARRVVSPEETGFIFEGGDKQAIKEAIIMAFEQQEKLSEMGQLAREEIIQHHNWDARVFDLIKAIKQSLEFVE